MISGSKEEILNLIKSRGKLQIDEAVELTKLAKTTLREHFLQLERDGYIGRNYIRSGPGRPSLQYELTQKGESLYPNQESKLLRELVRFLKETGSEDQIEEFFTRYWEKRYERARYLMDQASDKESRLEKLNEMLEEEGFMPKYEVGKNQVRIKECNCPFQELIKETRLPCRLEAEFYERLFDGEVKRTSYIADGDYSCRYDISVGEHS
jgi:predicted ArsR family transcriptional regulator